MIPKDTARKEDLSRQAKESSSVDMNIDSKHSPDWRCRDYCGSLVPPCSKQRQQHCIRLLRAFYVLGVFGSIAPSYSITIV